MKKHDTAMIKVKARSFRRLRWDEPFYLPARHGDRNTPEIIRLWIKLYNSDDLNLFRHFIDRQHHAQNDSEYARPLWLVEIYCHFEQEEEIRKASGFYTLDAIANAANKFGGVWLQYPGWYNSSDAERSESSLADWFKRVTAGHGAKSN